MYNEYDISVLAQNDAGDAPSATRMIGYSGEDGQCLMTCYCTHNSRLVTSAAVSFYFTFFSRLLCCTYFLKLSA